MIDTHTPEQAEIAVKNLPSLNIGFEFTVNPFEWYFIPHICNLHYWQKEIHVHILFLSITIIYNPPGFAYAKFYTLYFDGWDRETGCYVENIIIEVKARDIEQGILIAFRYLNNLPYNNINLQKITRLSLLWNKLNLETSIISKLST